MENVWNSLKTLLQYQIPLGGEKGVGVLNLLGAVFVLLLAYLLSRLARRAIRRGLGRVEEHRRFLIVRMAHWAILALGALVAFNALGLNLRNLHGGTRRVEPRHRPRFTERRFKPGRRRHLDSGASVQDRRPGGGGAAERRRLRPHHAYRTAVDGDLRRWTRRS